MIRTAFTGPMAGENFSNRDYILIQIGNMKALFYNSNKRVTTEKAPNLCPLCSFLCDLKMCSSRKVLHKALT